LTTKEQIFQEAFNNRGIILFGPRMLLDYKFVPSDSPIKEEDSALVFFFSGSRRVATAIVTKRSLPHVTKSLKEFSMAPVGRKR